MFRIFAVVFALVSQPVIAQERMGVLTMIGTGYVAAQPDIATARGFVNVQDGSAEKALAVAKKRVAALAETMKPLGEVAVSPVIVRRDRAAGKRILGSDEITFLARGSVVVRLAGVDGAGRALDAMVANGAGGAVSMEYGYANEAALLKQARELAVMDAWERAETYAKAADLSLGPVVDLREASSRQRTQPGGAPGYEERSYYSNKGASAPSVPAGVTVQVTIGWSLQ